MVLFQCWGMKCIPDTFTFWQAVFSSYLIYCICTYFDYGTVIQRLILFNHLLSSVLHYVHLIRLLEAALLAILISIQITTISWFSFFETTVIVCKSFFQWVYTVLWHTNLSHVQFDNSHVVVGGSCASLLLICTLTFTNLWRFFILVLWRRWLCISLHRSVPHIFVRVQPLPKWLFSKHI